MIGLINLLGKIITKVDAALSEKIVQEKDLIKEIFKEFLFASVYAHNEGEEQDVVKFKINKKKQTSSSSNKSREAAYKLLNDLIQKSPLLMSRFVKEQLQPLMAMIKKPNKWNYTPPGASSGIQKYVGLKNLGCICYMNSMMQQFFMTPAFRYNLLCVNDNIQANVVEYRGD
jgi:NADH dehydrogenase/NADH:ubiquinone oxidoreductase subunit G